MQWMQAGGNQHWEIMPETLAFLAQCLVLCFL